MEEERIERANSIEVSQNAKLEFSFKVKCYYGEEEHPEIVVEKINDIFIDLHSKFK